MTDNKIVFGIFLLMGLAVLTYLFITAEFLPFEWVFLENLLAEINVTVHDFGLFIAVAMIFGAIIFIPLGIIVIRLIVR